MQALDLGMTEVAATQPMQAPAPVRESDPAPSTNSADSADTTESFRAALRNEMSAEAAAANQSKPQPSASDLNSQTAGTQLKAGQKTSDAPAPDTRQLQAAERDQTLSQTAIKLNPATDKTAIAKATSDAAIQTAAHSAAANSLAKSDAEAASLANTAALARGAANSAAAGEKAISHAKATHPIQAAGQSDAPAPTPDAAPAPVAPVITALAAPALTSQPKPADNAPSDADGATLASVGTKRARRVMASQQEAGAAKAANAKTAQADAQATDAGTAASATRDAKLAAAADAGQAVAAAIAAQAGPQTHTISLHPPADAQAVSALQGAGASASVAGGHPKDNSLAANSPVANGAPEAGLSAHQVLSAGPTQLEVGVMDGTHGWLQIRAELGAGGAINTSLTGSATAHAPLQQSVPEMTSYLASESVSVSGIAVHKASETAGTMAWGQGHSEGQAAGTGSGASRGDGSSRDGAPVAEGASSGGQPSRNGAAPQQQAAAPIGLGWMGGVSPAVFARGFSNTGTSLNSGTGSWLSVRV